MWLLIGYLNHKKTRLDFSRSIQASFFLYSTSSTFLSPSPLLIFHWSHFALFAVFLPPLSPPPIAHYSWDTLTNTFCVSSSVLNPLFFAPKQFGLALSQIPSAVSETDRGRINVQVFREGGQEQGQMQSMTTSLWQINEGLCTAHYCWLIL